MEEEVAIAITQEVRVAELWHGGYGGEDEWSLHFNVMEPVQVLVDKLSAYGYTAAQTNFLGGGGGGGHQIWCRRASAMGGVSYYYSSVISGIGKFNSCQRRFSNQPSRLWQILMMLKVMVWWWWRRWT